MATVKQVIERAYTKVNGEFEVMSESSDDFRTYLNVLNQVVEQWAYTPYVKWQSLYDMDYRLPDPVAANQLVYPVANMDGIRVANTPFDAVYFLDDNGVEIRRYKMVDQAKFDSSNLGNICTMVSDGLHLKHVDDDIVGTSIRLPAYVIPAPYTLGSQEVKIDSVPWLVATMAAFIADASPVPFIARNADKFYAQAEIFMKTMREDNRRSQVLSLKRMGDRKFTSLSAAIDAGVGIGGGAFDSLDGGSF